MVWRPSGKEVTAWPGVVGFTVFHSHCAASQLDPVKALPFFLNGAATEWWYSLHAAALCYSTPLSWAYVHAEFLAYYDPQGRLQSVVAHHTLMDGQCTMMLYPSVTEYE